MMWNMTLSRSSRSSARAVSGTPSPPKRTVRVRVDSGSSPASRPGATTSTSCMYLAGSLGSRTSNTSSSSQCLPYTSEASDSTQSNA